MSIEVRVGDKIRLTGTDWDDYGLSEGDIVEVTDISEGGVIFAGQAQSVGTLTNGLYRNFYACEFVDRLQVGDEVILTGRDWKDAGVPQGLQVTIDSYVDPTYGDLGSVPSFSYKGVHYCVYYLPGEDYTVTPVGSLAVFAPVEEVPREEIVVEQDAISPSHYQFPGGAEVRHISEWLTANAAQALQYIARSSRIDGNNKGDAAEDIRKAIRFLEFELERLDV